MELYQLRSFVAVAEEMHVSRAAARLHLAQPTLSRQLAALERAVGVPLFSRTRRRLQLTSAGQVFLANARDILHRVDAATRDAHRAARGELGTLRLGFVQSAIYGAMPQLVGRFRSAYPDVQLEARALTTLRQIPALQAGEIDAGLLRPQQPLAAGRAGLRIRVLSRDALLAVLPAGHLLAAQHQVPLAALADEPFILYPKEEGSTGHDMIIDACAKAGFSPRIIQDATDAQTIVALVAAKLGVSLLLGPTPPVDPGLVVYRRLRERLPTWDLALAWRANDPSAVLARFLAVSLPGPEVGEEDAEQVSKAGPVGRGEGRDQ